MLLPWYHTPTGEQGSTTITSLRDDHTWSMGHGHRCTWGTCHLAISRTQCTMWKGIPAEPQPPQAGMR